jgi:mono/diheme cytochrome c family protein
MSGIKSARGHIAAALMLVACTVAGSLSLTGYAQQTQPATAGVYTGAQSQRGQAIFKEKCSACHGATLEGGLAPPLTGDSFMAIWGAPPLSELVNKILKTMPATEPGALMPPQVVDLVAYILQVGKFPAGKADLSADEAALKQIVMRAAQTASSPQPVALAVAHAPFPPIGNLGQVMKGIFFPSSNLIFNVQGRDPGEKRTGTPYEPGTASFSWVDWGAGIYSGWELVDYAAISLAEAAPLLMTPGRRCENGKPVPVTRPDWIQFTDELVEAGKAAYKASQSRNQEAVSDVSNQIADACLHCHEVYRDKPGGTTADPSNKAARCTP